MRRRVLSLLLTGVLLLGALSGCGTHTDPEKGLAATGSAAPTSPTELTTLPAPTVPADGDPANATCKGSYTGQVDADFVVASVHFEIEIMPDPVPAETTEDGETLPTEPVEPQITVVEQALTSGELQAWYWAEVAEYRRAGHEENPDYSQPLDTQPCPIDSSVNSWQQYFLARALDAWHTAAALWVRSQVEGLPTEAAHQPDYALYDKYLTDIPAVKYLYRYSPCYTPNTMHQAYLDEIPALLETLAAEHGYASAEELAQGAFGTTLEDAVSFVKSYNFGYMYFVSMSDYIEYTEADVDAELAANSQAYAADAGYTVDIRHALIVPGTETTNQYGHPIDPYEEARKKADNLLSDWQWRSRFKNEANFAEMANANSADTGTRLDGGGYQSLEPGQLRQELDAWCFDPARQPGDTTIIETEMGFHILYFSKKTERSYARAEDALVTRLQQQIIADTRERYPVAVDYSAITLGSAQPAVCPEDVLYPDIAHERFPEVPLYLQRNYPNSRYGAFPLTSYGCGITTLAMLASYMADEELTPPVLAARYGHYCHYNGTDGFIFNYEPSALGFYMVKKVYDPEPARQALKEGYIVVNVQHKGYWTSGGHYLVLEKLNEDGTVQIRDSNILNYKKVTGHSQDKHKWSTLIDACNGFWIYEPKITRIPACARCGDESQQLDGLLSGGYLCRKCLPAMLRRNTYLSAG